MTVRLLLVLVIFAILSGCERTSLPPEEAEKQARVERAESVPRVAPKRAPEPAIEEPPLDSTDELVGDFCHPEDVPDYRLVSAKGAGNDLKLR